MNKILVTGTDSGFGRYLVEKFMSEGYDIFPHHGRKDYDLRNVNEIEKLAKDAVNGGVTILVNNAGLLCPGIPLQQYTSESIIEMIDVNLKSPILLTYFMLPYLTNIININSMVSLKVKSPRTIYSATKSGLRGFSNSLRAELKDIKILDVYPTNIETIPGKKNSMNVYMVVDEIYNAFKNNVEELILDGIINKKIKTSSLE